MAQELTAKQQFWYEHVQQCERSGQTLAAYAAEHDLDVKRFYNWKWLLAKRGVVAGATVTEARFTQVHIADGAAGGWRLRFPNGCVLESDRTNEALLSAALSHLGLRR